ncbi:hypothetical protein [Desulforamulus aquiferis]|uniref:Uncharacterized protein n=1 Tax=Desulforamulus aquiferis TaxID=1397668 RepID=A0AAW7ZBH7_9FIRM|nr:hypothetical protein [Desulforamulus aquiferis]MDO7786509.1 hypothetical protein [Desulforamulus aquiferis]
MFRQLPNLNDPRLALFGLTLFSNANPGLENKLESFAQVLEATRNSISAIRAEMQNYQTSMYSLAQLPQKAATKNEFTTQPVHPMEEEPSVQENYTNQEYNQTYSNVPYQENYEMPVNTMEVKKKEPGKIKTQLERQLEKFLEEKPDKLEDFLNDIEKVLKKYR